MLAIRPSPAHQPEGSLERLPAEIILEIVPRIPYSPQNLSCLCLTCNKLNDLIKSHERSLVAEIKSCQFCSNTLALFPGLQPQTFHELNILHQRLETLDELHGKWLRIVNHGIELQWLKGRWENIHKAGLLLLYRMYDTGSYIGKIELMQSLPATSLACLLFKLISSIKILRIYGPEPINSRFAQEDAATRADVELAFEELLLQHGPEFFTAMLKEADRQGQRPQETVACPAYASTSCTACGKRAAPSRSTDTTNSSWAVRYVAPAFRRHFPRLSRKDFEHWLKSLADMPTPSALKLEVDSMYTRQLPFPNGEPKPPTLISSLRRALAKAADCEVGQTINKMWEILSSSAFDAVDDRKMRMVVGGEPIKGGFRRMGF